MKIFYFIMFILISIVLPKSALSEAFVDISKDNAALNIIEPHRPQNEAIRHHNQDKKSDFVKVNNKNNQNIIKNNYNRVQNNKWLTYHVTHYNRYTAHPVVRHLVIPVVVSSNKDSSNQKTSKVNTIQTKEFLDYKYNFSLGLHGIISLNSNLYDYEVKASEGIGFYFKFRPFNRFALHLTNDYMFGSLRYNDDISQDYIKTILSFGANIYLITYNSFDLYTIIAVSISWWSYSNNDNNICNTSIYKTGFQSGGSFGLGFSYTLNDFIEFSADFLYTLEAAPDFVPNYIQGHENILYEGKSNEIIHGMIFYLGIGFVL